MALQAAQVVVSSTATALNAADSDTVSGTTIVIKNTHATDALVLGDSGVAAGTGFSLAAGATLTLSLGAGDRVYGIRGSTNDITAHVLRIGV